MQVTCELKINEARCLKKLIKLSIKKRKQTIRYYKRTYDIKTNLIAREHCDKQKHFIELLKSANIKMLNRIEKPTTKVNCDLTEDEAEILKYHMDFWEEVSKGQKGQRLAIKLKEKILGNKEQE